MHFAAGHEFKQSVASPRFTLLEKPHCVSISLSVHSPNVLQYGWHTTKISFQGYIVSFVRGANVSLSQELPFVGPTKRGHVFLVLDTDFGHGLLLDMFGHVWTRFRIRQNDDQQPQNILDIFGHVWTRAVVCFCF